MKIYSAVGYALIALHVGMAELAAPDDWPVLKGALLGASYLLFIWVLSGLYVAHMLHMGLAHRALEFRGWFLKTVTVASGLLGIYVDPRAWVNRHRLHHAFSDHPGDPNKTRSDGFWKTVWLCLRPYPCRSDLATDPVFKTPVFRTVCHPAFAVLSQLTSFAAIWLTAWALAGSLLLAAWLWIGVRLCGLWVNMIQNFWTHDRRYGTRRYDEADNDAMNITEWLPVTATFSACFQNNHHRHARFARMSHEAGQYDFGWTTVRWMAAAGLVRVLPEGAEPPPGVLLSASAA